MSTAGSASSVRDQRIARVIDREVAPVWHDRFARLILRDIPIVPKTFTLDVHSGTGRTTAELLQRLDDSSRVLALEADASMTNLAKGRVRPEWKQRVYFKSGNFDQVLEMGDDTYDLTIANLVLGEVVHDWGTGLRELIRITKPGGQVFATMPLAGTWQEVDDLFEEVLRDAGLRREITMLHRLRRLQPTATAIARKLAGLGLEEEDYILEHERFELLFRSGREFLFAPVVEHGPLRLWKAILGNAEKPQELFWRFKEAIDTYYAGRVLSVSARAALVRVRRPNGDGSLFSSEYFSRFPTLDALWNPNGPDEADIDIDFDDDDDDDDVAAATPSAARSTTRHVVIEEDEADAVLDALEGDEGLLGADELDELQHAVLPGGDDDDDDLASAFGEMLLPDDEPASKPSPPAKAAPKKAASRAPSNANPAAKARAKAAGKNIPAPPLPTRGKAKGNVPAPPIPGKKASASTSSGKVPPAPNTGSNKKVPPLPPGMKKKKK